MFAIFSYLLSGDECKAFAHLNKIGNDVKLLCLANLVIGICNTFNGASFSCMNLLCATLLAYGLGRIRGKQDTLEEERALHEWPFSLWNVVFSEFSKSSSLPACIPVQAGILFQS